MVQALATPRFVVWIEADNVASRGVARNVGFVECGMEINEGKPMLRFELVT
jgi:L-amino acid N-acyltransferase YncA